MLVMKFRTISRDQFVLTLDIKNTYTVEDEHFFTTIAYIPGPFVCSEDRSNICSIVKRSYGDIYLLCVQGEEGGGGGSLNYK
jgi:hypothetical protein